MTDTAQDGLDLPGMPAPDQAADLLDASSPPTAVVCVSDPVAAGAVITLQSRGLAPGRDVAVAVALESGPGIDRGTVGATYAAPIGREVLGALLGGAP